MLREGDFLVPGYSEKAFALFEEYHPDEIDFSKPFDFRKKRMDEWWSKHFQLLIDSGLNKKDIENISKDKRIKLRGDIEKFLTRIEKENIPLIIISASGVGDSIKMILEKEKLNFPNIHIIANAFEFDKDGTEYRVEYSRKSTLKLVLKENGVDISSHSSTNTLKTLQTILGFDFKLFWQLIYQSSTVGLEFLTATDTNRKKFLINLYH